GGAERSPFPHEQRPFATKFLARFRGVQNRRGDRRQRFSFRRLCRASALAQGPPKPAAPRTYGAPNSSTVWRNGASPGRLSFRLALVALALVAASAAAADPAKQPTPAFPLKTADGGRYLVDQNGVPFLIAGESPQALMVNLSEEDAERFFANRQSHGFNAAWINLLCRPGTGGRPDGSTFDGLRPFESGDDFSKPNEAYFARCDRMVRLAAKHGTLVILDPCETIDHLKPMLKNGPQACRNFGRYLGKRYKDFDNIVWMSGNDFQTWKQADHDAVVTAVALGIKDEDSRHLHTVELNYLVSGSRDDDRWASIVDLSAAYTYYPPYAQVLKEYNRTPAQPVVMIESDYEFERDSTPAVLRRQEYWSLLSGAAGQLYGNGYTWPFKAGWQEKLDTPGAKQMAHVQALFTPRAWYKLVPDQKHKVVKAGYGTLDGTTTEGDRYVMTSDYVTAARTPDGALAMAYLPSLRTIQVDMTQLAGPVAARWYDPSRGTYTAAADSLLPNTGERAFTPPGNNGDGDGDWVLVLETTPPKEAGGR
ncbi:MAG TPA: glycoside hydrolase family 140 protein, partial [Gemmataceae bacterium]|nr:glycoside hydrolase family 140 protein [Gemmataceae bacterium]